MTRRTRNAIAFVAVVALCAAAFVALQRDAEDPVDHGPATGAAPLPN